MLCRRINPQLEYRGCESVLPAQGYRTPQETVNRSFWSKHGMKNRKRKFREKRK